MARIRGVEVDLGGAFRAGAAFRCTLADRDGVVLAVADGQRVEVRPREGIVVAQLRDPADTGYAAANEAAQRALDITGYLGGPSLSLTSPHHEFVQWWNPPDGCGHVVRVVITREVGVTVGVSPSFGQGERPNWTPALRFFRYAQLADDVFDAYRNMYLGLEAVLSELVVDAPPRERAWLVHALQTVVDRGLDLSRYLASVADDPVAAFVEKQYEAFRCATFHAKRDRGALLPGSAQARESVAEALEHLAQMVIDLAEPVVGRRRLAGAMYPKGFEALVIAPKVGNLKMELLSREDRAVVESIPMSTGYLGPIPNATAEHLFGGELPAEQLAGREFDGVRVTAAGAGGPAGGPFDETFDFLPTEVSGAQSFQISLVFALNNLQLPRTRFPR